MRRLVAALAISLVPSLPMLAAPEASAQFAVGHRILRPKLHRIEPRPYCHRPLDLIEHPVHAPISNPYTGQYPAHSGADMAVPRGTRVHTTAKGRVVTVRHLDYSYGNYVVVKVGCAHLLFAHLKRTLVHTGERVRRWQAIGRSGSTGNSTGPHLHFEVRKHGRTVNPAGYLR